MPFRLPDPTTPSGESVARRLHDEHLIWLTTVDAKGVPQPTPVWFLWDDLQSTLLIYSRANARRLIHIQQNPVVTLHLESSGGRDIVIITGEARISADDPPADQLPAWVEKYHDFFLRFQTTPKQLADALPVPLRIHPMKLRHSRNGT